MHQTNKQALNGYEFFITTALTAEQRHRGVIIFTKRGDVEAVVDPSFFVETPSAFKSVRAAGIEASVYARELIRGGHICIMLGKPIETRRNRPPTEEIEEH